jgi:hypothetical protein
MGLLAMPERRPRAGCRSPDQVSGIHLTGSHFFSMRDFSSPDQIDQLDKSLSHPCSLGLLKLPIFTQFWQIPANNAASDSNSNMIRIRT